MPASPSSDARRREPWWRMHPFRGMVHDVRRRLPYYVSDWTDAWDYRVVPATVYMYFAKYVVVPPALPLLPSALPASVPAGQPAHFARAGLFPRHVLQDGLQLRCERGAAGVGAGQRGVCDAGRAAAGHCGRHRRGHDSTVYDIMQDRGIDYLAFMAWIGIWALILHVALAILNSCNCLRWVTRFPCDIFGFYVACIYVQKGIQVLDRLGGGAPFYLSVMAALLVFVAAYTCGMVGKSSLFRREVRAFLNDYGTPLTLIFFTGFVHIGRMADVPLAVLPTGIAFEPTLTSRTWLVRFWHLGAGDVFLALPFAVLLTILFWFDHNVSSLIAQGSEFPLRKPAGFHWDLFLLGITTGIAGILGLPFPNGLIPQAPFHTQSLCVTGPDNKYTHVVEQRFSNFAQGLLTLGTMTGPLLVCLHLIPHGVLAGLFFVMGIQALEANGITAKLVFLARDHTLTPSLDPLSRVERRAAIWIFVAIELLGFGATFAITQTIAAVGFPVFIFLLIPLRATVLPRILSASELHLLDAPTASDFTMEGIGGSWGKPDERHDQPRERQPHGENVALQPSMTTTTPTPKTTAATTPWDSSSGAENAQLGRDL
ncbi:Bicarbonate transporter, eukaryotic [Moelleriella libera RCEF 2490]|uniref:Bicarbonate transporter, eukaryotic n=1 Tax=Moelleriella libera RCEF 2490 TaxID=1081109 RepID=A0A167W2R9_9HYPO|nr:Bicarbonate transporter, eukaryotic [Moelleriella libera RCEF 2490]